MMMDPGFQLVDLLWLSIPAFLGVAALLAFPGFAIFIARDEYTSRWLKIIAVPLILWAGVIVLSAVVLLFITYPGW